MAALGLAVCDSACQDPVRTATAKPVTATRKASGFIGFMEDNSTGSDTSKIQSAAESTPEAGLDSCGTISLSHFKAVTAIRWEPRVLLVFVLCNN
jgi:hypothetical protein